LSSGIYAYILCIIFCKYFLGMIKLVIQDQCYKLMEFL